MATTGTEGRDRLATADATATEEVSLTPEQVIFFNRQLASMAKLNMPIAKGLRILADEVTDPGFKRVIASIQRDLEEGRSLQEALGRYPQTFTHIYLEMLRAGETTGNLAVIMDELTEYTETMRSVNNKIRDAIAYPVLVLCVTIAFVLYFLYGAVPQFKMTFQDRIPPEKMPIVTQTLFFVSDMVRTPIVAFVLFSAVAGGLGLFIWRLRVGMERYDEFMLVLPIFGRLFRQATLLKMCRTMHDLLLNGVSMVHALRLTARTIGENRFQGKLEQIRASVEEGESFARAISAVPEGEKPVFPETMMWKLQMGEEKGIIEEAFHELVKEFQSEVETTVSQITRLLAPAMLVGIAFVVALMLVAFYLPMFQAGTTVQ